MITGYITEQQLAEFRLMDGANRIISDQLNDLIDTDLRSDYKGQMKKGVLYYKAKHDIQYKERAYYVEGKKILDQMGANNKIPHPFHKVLVNQKITYVAGNAVVISVSIETPENPNNPTPQEEAAQKSAKRFHESLMDLLGNSFDDKLADWIKESSNKGQGWFHPYINSKGELKYIIVPSEEIIAVYDTQYQDKLVMIIRYYQVEYINDHKQKETRYKAEIWTEENVTYYAQLEDETRTFVLDPDYDVNPAGHFSETNTGTGVSRQRGWGKIPFIRLANNSELQTDLEPVKLLIDGYDKVKSGWIDDLQDFQEMIYVLKDYVGLNSNAYEGYSELAMFMENLKSHKVIAVEGTGGVDTIKAEIPVEAKEKFLDLTRKEIYYFGEGVDVDADKFGQNPSGVSLKFTYSLLDLKANRTIRKLKAALTELLWFVVEYMKLKDAKAAKFNPEDVLFTFNKAVIFNEKEKIEALAASEGQISQQTILENHPFVDDVEEEMKRLDAEKQKRMEEGLDMLNNIPDNQSNSSNQSDEGQ